MVLVGVAGPLVMPPVMALLLNAVPNSRAGVASGVFNTSRQIGGALAVAVFGALLTAPAGFLHGLRTSLLLASAVALAAAAAASLLLAPQTPAAEVSRS
jgi:sugar phosphate permease